jgi:hypothetical protein
MRMYVGPAQISLPIGEHKVQLALSETYLPETGASIGRSVRQNVTQTRRLRYLAQPNSVVDVFVFLR